MHFNRSSEKFIMIKFVTFNTHEDNEIAQLLTDKSPLLE